MKFKENEDSERNFWIDKLRGGLVRDAEVARSIGELLLRRHYGPDQVERQTPLQVTDRGDYWRIEGSWNPEGELEGCGPFFMSIVKSDGRVKDFGIWAVIHTPPDVLERLKAGPPKQE